jgi:hypothetical protein
VAHIREQGVDLIIVFVSDRVRWMNDTDVRSIVAGLTVCARSAGLAGHVVLVWPGGFYADRPLHPFFESAQYELLAASINKKLNCQNV